MEAYNAAANTWSRKSSFPVEIRGTNGAVVLAGKIYVSGGWTPDGATTKGLYVYTPATNSWGRKADLPIESAQGASGAINGKMYVVVGFQLACKDCDNVAFPRRLYVYTPATDSWKRLADPPSDGGMRVAGVIDGKLYVAWGDSIATDMYDPSTNRWTKKVRQNYGGTGNTCPMRGGDRLPSIGHCRIGLQRKALHSRRGPRWWQRRHLDRGGLGSCDEYLEQ